MSDESVEVEVKNEELEKESTFSFGHKCEDGVCACEKYYQNDDEEKSSDSP